MPRHNHIRAHQQQQAARDLDGFVEDVKDVLGLRDDDETTTKKQRTSTAVVYVTLKPTFTGEIAGYSTVAEPDEVPVAKTTKKPSPKDEVPTPTPTPTKPKTTLAQVTSKPAAKSSASSSNDETSLLSSIKVSKNTSGTAKATADIDLDNDVTTTKAAGTPLSQSSSSSTSSAVAGITDGGMSGGAKAGVAIGVILGLGLIAGLVFFIIRKKKQSKDNVDNEKTDNFGPGFVGAGAAVAGNRSEKPMANAPRLDVRPTTAFFMPNRASQMAKIPPGNGNLMSAQNNSPAQSGWERPMNQDNNNASNPFGDNAAAIDPVNARGPSQINGTGIALAAGAAGAAVGAAAANRSNSPVNGQNDAVGAVIKGPVRSTSRGGANKYSPTQNQGPFSDAARTDGGAQGTAQLVQSGNTPMPLSGVIEEGGGPLSPKSAGFPGSPGGPVIVGVATGAAIGAAAPSDLPLYRVHLDFSPSMPDELRVRAGEIVRLLKEFDDGWCMCTSDDLKREGVLPRTCISNRPIRRPQNGPGSGPPGPMGPMGPNGQRRMSPPQNRGPPPMNNNGGRGSPAPGHGPQYRPQQRGPGPNGRPQGPPQQGRPMSPAMSANGRNSPGPGYNGPGPQYRPQQNGRPMSPAMGPNGGSRTPQQRGPGPNSPMGQGMGSPAQQQGQFQQQQQPRSQTPQGQTPRALQAGIPSPESVAHIAANFPLPGSPTVSEAPRSPRAEQVEFSTAVPEVIVTGSASPVQVGQPQQVERKPVGRKPLPGQAQ